MICPDCFGEMVRVRLQHPDGSWFFGWGCDCDENTRDGDEAEVVVHRDEDVEEER